jgi:hypothetical protein
VWVSVQEQVVEGNNPHRSHGAGMWRRGETRDGKSLFYFYTSLRKGDSHLK